jgi:hypothetical protein
LLYCIYTYTFSGGSLLEFQTLDNWISKLIYSYIGARVK